MKLRELINIAKYSELNTLRVKDNDEVIVSFINLGLIEIYGLFPLYTEEFIVELVTGQTIYELPQDFMYLTGAYEYDRSGELHDLPINEEKNPLSVNTINFKEVQIPASVTGAEIGITYVSKPKVMTVEEDDEEIPLPPALIQPLLNFLAFKGHSSMSVDREADSNVYYERFVNSCDQVKKRGLGIASDDLNMDNRINQRGFV